MRLEPPPPDVGLPWRGVQANLLRAVSTALWALAPHDRTVARALSELGAIDLPDGAPNAMDAAQLQAAGPLYFASELERAGLLSTAELVAGLFASGSITQPLGPVAQQLNAFWRGRKERLEQSEREAIFARAIEPPHFDRLMAALCAAIVAQADGTDLREGVTLSTTAQAFAEFLSQRVDSMASIAAGDIVGSINAALGFLRDRMLQAAFGANSLWSLLSFAGAVQGQGAVSVRNHVDRGRAGQTVLLWLAAHYGEQAPQLDPSNSDDAEVIGAAQRWLSARPLASDSPPGQAGPALPIAA